MSQTRSASARDVETTASGAINVATPPRLERFRFRLFRGPDDYPGMIRANMAARRSDGILERVTVEGMANMYANLPHCDPYQDALIGEIDGEIVAYGRVEWANSQDGARDYSAVCLVDPAYRRHGIGRGMLEWQEHRTREIAAGHDTDRPRFHYSFVYDRDVGGGALLTSSGYEVVRRGAEMVRQNLDDIPEARAPDGLVLRPGAADLARPVWEAVTEIFKDHWGPSDENPEEYAQFINNPEFDPSLWVVAWDGDQIAGVVWTSIQPGRTPTEVVGYLDSVGVRKAWRRRGVGRAIVAEALRVVKARGATLAGLGVDLQNQNAAADLYASVGFEVTTTSREFRKPLLL